MPRTETGDLPSNRNGRLIVWQELPQPGTLRAQRLPLVCAFWHLALPWKPRWPGSIGLAGWGAKSRLLRLALPIYPRWWRMALPRPIPATRKYSLSSWRHVLPLSRGSQMLCPAVKTCITILRFPPRPISRPISSSAPRLFASFPNPFYVAPADESRVSRLLCIPGFQRGCSSCLCRPLSGGCRLSLCFCWEHSALVATNPLRLLKPLCPPHQLCVWGAHRFRTGLKWRENSCLFRRSRFTPK